MFSCREAMRRTLERLERRLSLAERLSRRGHLALCRHCRAHARQIRRLLFALEHQERLADISLPRLSAAARARIAAAMAEANRQ